jgi:hypothetical protein
MVQYLRTGMIEFLNSFNLKDLTRRDFLKLSGAGLLSLFFLPYQHLFSFPNKGNLVEPVLPTGRILGASVNVYNKPSLSGKLVKVVWRDLVTPITGATIGDPEPAYNRIWYEVNNEGFVHSGSIQPVEASNNPVLNDIPEEGQLAEVTVPFTDTVWNPKYPNRYAYRLYYSTVYWLKGVLLDEKGKSWYRVWDERLGLSYFGQAEHFRPLYPEDLIPISPQVLPEAKRLEVRLNEQVTIAYENDTPVFMARVATGAHFRDGNYQTPFGHFITNRKRPTRHMASGDPAAPNGFDLPGIPWVSYLTKSGISFHGTYWHNDFGRPRSHGCINCSSSVAQWIYLWTLPQVPLQEETWEEDFGTAVDVVA